MANSSLHAAKKGKNDEFYTQLPDIEKELFHYWEHFKGKTILCNCDDPYESNFFKYFALHFNHLGLRKLIATCYDGSPITGQELLLQFDWEEEQGGATSLSRKESNDEESAAGMPHLLAKKVAYKVEITEVKDLNGDGTTDLSDIRILLQNDKNVLKPLKGNGDFRSAECIELLKEADIVVTNPPFSLFREYVAQLIEHNKQFLIIGNQNAITYKEIFPLIRDNKMWLGFHSGHTLFSVPDSYGIPDFYNPTDTQKLRSNGYVFINGKLWRNLGNICWFTNLDHKKRHEPLILWKQYTPEDFPKYDNYNAIDVSKVAEIPIDYQGVMGVPITFLDKYCPEQFEILELGNSRENFTPNKDYINPLKHTKDGKVVCGGAINCVLAINYKEKPVGQVYYTSDNSDYLVPPYARILIRRKQ